jgi:hypothetical protein
VRRSTPRRRDLQRLRRRAVVTMAVRSSPPSAYSSEAARA